MSKELTDMTEEQSEPEVILRIDFPTELKLGWGKAQLLDHIRSTGSISAGGKKMNMSYRRAWMLVEEMNNMFLHPVVETTRGGKTGGGTALTGFGEELLACYRRMQQKAESALKDDMNWLSSQSRKSNNS